jgi:hypothetical protein
MTEEIKASEPAQAWTAADFTKELLTGTRQNGLHWSTIEDLFQQAMDAGARHYAAQFADCYARANGLEIASATSYFDQITAFTATAL